MTHSFQTRLVDSAARAVVLALCLLICLACATPFPVERLEVGMAEEAVRAEFGEPESIDEWMGAVVVGRDEAGKRRFAFPKGPVWDYRHEEGVVELYFLANKLHHWKTNSIPGDQNAQARSIHDAIHHPWWQIPTHQTHPHHN